MLETTKEERVGWASPIQMVPNSYKRQAQEWKEATHRLCRDVNTLEEVLGWALALLITSPPSFETDAARSIYAKQFLAARAVLAPKDREEVADGE